MAFIRALTGGSQSVPLPEKPVSEGELSTQVQGPRAKTTEDVGGIFARLFQRRENREPTPTREVQALKPVIIPISPKTYKTDILTIGNAIREVYNSGETKSIKEFTKDDEVRQWLGEVKSRSSAVFTYYIDAGLSSFPPQDRARFKDALIERKVYRNDLSTICNVHKIDLLTIGNAIREVYNLEEGRSTEEFTSDADVNKWLAEIKSKISNEAFDGYLQTALKGLSPKDRAQVYKNDLLTIGNAIREVYNLEEGRSTEEFTTDSDVKNWLDEVKSKISSEDFGRYLLTAWKGFPHEKRAELMDAYYQTLRTE